MPAPFASNSSIPRIILCAAAVIAAAALVIGLMRKPKIEPAGISASKDAGPLEGGATIADLEAQAAQAPGVAETWARLGMGHVSRGNYAEAVVAYARAVQIEPKTAQLWSALGEAQVLASSGSFPDDARASFERALTIDAKDPRARYFLGVAQDMAGDHQGAIRAWLALLEDTPPGAPWEHDVRRLIEVVGAKEGIQVQDRLSAIDRRMKQQGSAIATAAIPGPSLQQMQAARTIPKGQQDAMVQSMVTGLESKLASDPRNLNGWIMLMRSRATLGEAAKASVAYTNAKKAFVGNQPALEQLASAAAALDIR